MKLLRIFAFLILVTVLAGFSSIDEELYLIQFSSDELNIEKALDLSEKFLTENHFVDVMPEEWRGKRGIEAPDIEEGLTYPALYMQWGKASVWVQVRISEANEMALSWSQSRAGVCASLGEVTDARETSTDLAAHLERQLAVKAIVRRIDKPQ